MGERYYAHCTYVEDGDTFKTAREHRIRLANVCTPEKGRDGYLEAKKALADLILDKGIVYEPVGTSCNRIVAEVWVGATCVNQYMRNQGYTCR
jgi:endonuclease YncB( thermonuclease family)